MTKDILKRLEALENEEIIEIEDISMYERVGVTQSGC